MPWWNPFSWDDEVAPAPPIDNEAQRAQQLAARWRASVAPTGSAPTVGPQTDPLASALDRWRASQNAPTGSAPMQGPLRPGETRPMLPQVGPVIAPPPPPGNPWMSAVNAWREGPPSQPEYNPLSSAPPPRAPSNPFSYDIQPTSVDYALDRPVTGVSSFTGQQMSAPTVGSSIAPYDPYAPHQSDAWGITRPAMPSNAAFNTSVVDTSNALNYGVDMLQGWRGAKALLGAAGGLIAEKGLAGFVGEGSNLANSAAGERFMFDVTNRQNEEQNKRGFTWGDWAGDLGSNLSGIGTNAYNAMTENNKLIRQIASGEKTPAEAWKEYNLAEMGMTPLQIAGGVVGSAMDITDPTNAVKQGALDVASGLQFTQDAANTTTYKGVPLGAYWSTLFTAAKDAGLDLMAGQTLGEGMQLQRAAAGFIDSAASRLEEYRAGTTPTAQQLATMTPAEVARQQDRANLNWADPAAVAKTFDALVDQNGTATALEQKAKDAMRNAGLAQNDEERDSYLIAAADYGAQSYDLKNKHPQALVNENTNIPMQMLFEIMQPDITDLAGGVLSLLELTPAARRLTRATSEVMTPVEKVIEGLAPMTQAAATAAQSGYNPKNLLNFSSYWTTGTARADMKAGQMHSFVTGLLSDVDTAADAKILLRQLAQDPTKLMSGMASNLFQSEGLLARADAAGMVRFGGMNLNNAKEALTIFQKNANELIDSLESLSGGPIYNKVDFANEFKAGLEQAGYRYYNVATSLGDAPIGTTSARVKSIENKQVVIEYLNGKEVIKTSEAMDAGAGRALANDLTKQAQAGRMAERSVPGVIASSLRKMVSPFYIFTSPGTWDTNIIANASTALGDGSLAGGRIADMAEWKNKIWGVDPTVRGLEGTETAANVAGQTMSGFRPLAPLKKAYSAIEENFGTRVWTKSAKRAMHQVGPEALQQGMLPIFNAIGITDYAAQKTITSQLFEVGVSGGNIASEFGNILAGKSKLFSLSNVNKAWLDAIPAEKVESFHDILRTAADPASAKVMLQKWYDDTVGYYDNLIQEAPIVPQQHVWMKQEVSQDMADLAQTGKMAERAGVDAAEVTAWKQATGAAMNEVERKFQTLTTIVAEASDPKARYALYNVWGQVHEMTTGVRMELGEMAEGIYGMAKADKPAAWQAYWKKARELWDNRNAKASEMLEQGAAAMNKGEDFAPKFDYWTTLERQASTNEQKLWDSMRLEPQSGAYDARMKTVIDAGRQLADKSIARVYAAARRFTDVNAIDHVLSAEKNAAMAGAQARSYLDKVLDKAIKSGKWEDYYSIRNETWRQLRQYEQQVWGIAERNIVRDGLATETKTGLKFESGPDGLVELVAPENVATPRTSMLGPQKTVTTEQAKYWTVKREDGTITRVPDNMVPAELKKKYDALTPEEIELQVQGELDNIASAEPFADDALKMLSDEPPTIRWVGPGSDEFDDTRRAQRQTEIAANAADVAGGSKEARQGLASEWDRVAKAEKGYAGIDQLIASHTRNGIVNVPENKFEDLYGLTVAGRKIENSADVNRLLQEYYDLGQQAKTARQTGVQAAPVADKKLQKRVTQELNLGASNTVGDVNKAADETIRNTRKAGAVQNPDMALAAQHARESLQNMFNYVNEHMDEIMRPKNAIGEGQSLTAIDTFRKQVLPIWDNVKATAAKYGDDMRSFSLVDFSNNTRLDEMIGLYAPYAFWYTRTIKNSAERALFEPHIWRRTMQAEKYIADMNEQRGDPARFKGAIPFTMPNGDTRYLRISPSKYWSTAGLFTHNDYADPESANNAYSFGVESAQSMGFNGYFFADIANQAAQNSVAGKPLMTDIYPMSYIPQGKMIGWAASQLMGPNIPQWIRPGYYEYNVGRELTTMVSEGAITGPQAQYAQEMLRQMRTGEATLPEVQAQQEELAAILKMATERAAQKELLAAGTSLATGIGVRTMDKDEKTALEAQRLYAQREYNPIANPYGGETAQNATFQEHPELGPKFSQGAIYDSDKPRPGASASMSEKIQATKDAKDALYLAGDTAVNEYLAAHPDATKNQISDARNAGVLEAAGGMVDPAQLNAFLGTQEKPYYGNVVKFVADTIEKQYPSADLLQSTNKPKDYNPLEQKVNFQEATLKQATTMFPYPTYPEGGTPAQIGAYMKEKAAVDAQREQWTMNQLTQGGGQLTPNWMKGSTALDNTALTTTPEDAKRLMTEDKYKYKTDAERKRLEEIEATGYGGGSKEFAAARNAVASRFGKEDLAVWDGYYALPKGEAREQYKLDNPGFKLTNLYAYNRKETEAALTEVGIDGALAWTRVPAYADTPEAKAARGAYYDKNPKAFLFGAYLNGRPANYDESKEGSEGHKYNWGVDYLQAKEMFGADIWSLVSQYKRGWDGTQKRMFFEKNPQYGAWSDWWYGNEKKERGTSGGGRGGGGFGGYAKAAPQERKLQIRMPDVYGQGLSGGLGDTPRIAGYQNPSLDTSWMNAGRELRPGAPREWTPDWIRGIKKS